MVAWTYDLCLFTFAKILFCSWYFYLPRHETHTNFCSDVVVAWTYDLRVFAFLCIVFCVILRHETHVCYHFVM